EFSLYATPRRIAFILTNIPVVTDDMIHEYKGPALSAAYTEGDPSKEPTKALEGFARSKGIDVADIEIRTVEGVDYVFATTTEKGRLTSEILPKLLSEVLESIQWPKTQRWGSGDVRFVRPIRWLVALFGNKVIPVQFGDIVSDRYTSGHRFIAPQKVELATPKEYAHVLKGNKVNVSPQKRRADIEKGAREVSKDYGEVLLNNEVLDEVVNLAEFPQIALGTFDEEFLRGPREILEYAMGKHQRYFAVQRKDGSLDHHFVVVSDGDPDFKDQIVEGHERVIRARLADVVFFYDEDLKIPLDDWLTKLEKAVFQEKLGSVRDKVQRIESLIDLLAQYTEISDEERTQAMRAARLAKADLATSAVIEFTDLQGIMGSRYALAQGENGEVARAIREHYRPRFSGDDLPTTLSGKLISIADKMDTIAGIFAIGNAPTGTSDPYALRRSAIGILQILLDTPFIDLDSLISAALDQYVGVIDFDYETTYEQIRAFFMSRLEVILKGEGTSSEVVSAVLARVASEPYDAVLRSKALEEFIAQDNIINLSTALKRAKNLAQPQVGMHVDTALLSGPEKELNDALEDVAKREPYLSAQKLYPELLTLYSGLRRPVDDFFDGVMIMDKDETLKKNRLAILNTLVELVERFADLSRLSVK
ncbi:MAG: glycine--tRNA ligase subunit beta, partial [Coriobacteriia bacterium]|nr:glycine--tRNA ligase subunit beta [Coriobacteriia bacterium]